MQPKFRCFMMILLLIPLLMISGKLYSQSMKIKGDKMALWNNKDGPRLRGMNLHQRRTYREWDNGSNGAGIVGPPFTQEEMNHLSNLNANWVDISHPGLFSEKPPYQLDKGMQDNLDKLLEMTKKAGLFATITFRTGPGRSEFSFIGGEDQDPFVKKHIYNEVWKNESAQKAWAQMWRYTANRYKDNPIVVGYKLMCEPNAEAVIFDIYDPDEFYPKYANTTYDWNRFYPQIISAIREVDPDTPILLSPMGWASVRWLLYLKPSSAGNIVYTIHQYAPQKYTHQEAAKYKYPDQFDMDEDGTAEPFDKKWLDHLLSLVDAYARKNKVTLAVGESGLHRWAPDADRFIHDQLDLFEKRGLNYVMWDWNSKFRIAQCPKNDSFSLLPGPDPKNHKEVPNKLFEVVLKYWKKNKIKPGEPI